MEEKGILEVRMMGDFSVAWDGNNICSNPKTPDSQITRLLQVLIYNRNEGVERSKLQSLIFDDSNSDDTGHLLRSVIYNAQKKLEQSDLPHARYIEFRDGRYYWTDDIPVRIDTEIFEHLCIEAELERDPDEKLDKLLKATYAYKGDFLPDQTGLSWVAGEERRLKHIFRLNTEEVAEILRENRDYAGMEILGNYAVSVCPLDDWETLLIEAYIFTGRLSAAQTLYEKTAERYQKELGIRPVPEQVNRIEHLFEQADRTHYNLEDIESDLREEAADGRGMYCAYPIFRGIYRALMRSLPAQSMPSWLVLCTLKVEKGKTGSVRIYLSDAIAEHMKTAICESTESCDIVCRFGREQYLILLRNRTDSDCEAIKRRIKEKFEEGGKKSTSVTFSMRKIEGHDSDSEGGAL